MAGIYGLAGLEVGRRWESEYDILVYSVAQLFYNVKFFVLQIRCARDRGRGPQLGGRI